MNSKLQQKLFKKYPKLFRQRKLPMSQTAMCWGIDTPDSWYWLIDTICMRIQSMIDNNKETKCDYPQIEFVQVKEKFGYLRMHYYPYRPYYEGIISLGAQISAQICTNCGKIGNTSPTRGWVIYLCKKCHLKRKSKDMKK